MKTAQNQTASSVDEGEISRFAKVAEQWWDPHGKFKPLHRLNPCRIGYIKSQICAHFSRAEDTIRPFEGLALLDIGCGGGLMSEPMCRLGANVTGIDATEKNIPVAQLHAEQGGLAITYRHAAAEDLLAEPARFDVVLALEIVEHVVDPASFVASCASLLKPGGLLVMSTLNRTPKSYALAIVGAEYILRWLPRGTHSWKKFLRPSELHRMLRAANMEIVDTSGMVMHPLTSQWRIDARDLDVNYLVTAKVESRGQSPEFNQS